jgi:hypothetical protein
MLIARRRYEWEQKNYFKNLYEQYGKIPDNHKEAIEARQAFFRFWVLDRVIFYLTRHHMNMTPLLKRIGLI